MFSDLQRGAGTALLTRQQLGKRPQYLSKGKKDFPRDQYAFCDYHGIKEHETEQCETPKRAEDDRAKNGRSQANIAQGDKSETVPTAQIAKIDVDYDSEASAFLRSIGYSHSQTLSTSRLAPSFGPLECWSCYAT
jgi:hypothetical protein